MPIATVRVVLLVIAAVGCSYGLTITGRHLLIPGPVFPNSTAVAFDFNGVSLNTTIEPDVQGSVIETVEIALTTPCYVEPTGNISNTSFQPQRFIVYWDGVLSLEPRYVDTVNSTCNETTWFTIFNASMNTQRAPISSPTNVSIFKITEPDWNAANASIANYVIFHALRVTSVWSGDTRRRQTHGTLLPQRYIFHVNPAKKHFQNNEENTSSESENTVRRIEFIGDSITAGYCNTCNLFPPNTTNNYALEDFSYSWVSLVCRGFAAECHNEAWSGRGVIQNCDDSFPTVMPSIVQRALATVVETESVMGVSNQWNFDSFVPDVIVVNLGTNDFACNPIANITVFEAEFEAAYVNMLSGMLAVYGNRTKGVFLACGPMVDTYCPSVLRIIDDLRALGRSNVFFLNQTNLLPPSEMCCGHPDTIIDEVLANVTIETISHQLFGKVATPRA